MAKGEKKKRSDRSNGLTPDASPEKLRADCSASSVVSLKPRSEDGPVEVSPSVPVPQPPLHHGRTDAPEIHEIPVISKILVQRYEGEKCGEVLHGEGVAFFQGGHVYKGSFANGLMHGRGEYTWADGLKYEGELASNIPTERGRYTWLDGSTYEGEIYCGIRHGVGTYKCAKTNTVYRGQWYHGKRHGKGIVYYNLEITSWYEGDWQNNQREGWGVCCYPSGNIYEGQWKNNVQHGEGRMRWVHLGQQYCGQWVNGVQHGYGTHTWILRRAPGSQYPLRNEYKGEFMQGLRHGNGTFFYASGAQYSGDWKHNTKHGQGKFIFKNGLIYEGEFLEDRMAEFPAFSVDGAKTPDLSRIRTRTPPTDEGDLRSRAKQSSISVLGADMVLNIQTLLNQMPESQRDQELRQVEFAVMRHTALLRALYSLYGSLGHERSPDNTFLLTRLQFWRFLKDCSVHHHGVTLAQIDRLTDEDVSPEEARSPFCTMLLRKYVSCIVIAAYHIYHKHIESSVNVLEACFSRLMKHNIIPNARNIKGPFFCHPLRAVIGMRYADRCWEVYHTLCTASSSTLSDQTMTARHFIWMLKDLGLFDSELTTVRVLEILVVDNPAFYSAAHCNLDLEITFLEFFEALLSCAEVKTSYGIRRGETGRTPRGDMRDMSIHSQGETGRTPRGDMRDTSIHSHWNSSQIVKTISTRHSSPDEDQHLKNQESDSVSKLDDANGEEMESINEAEAQCVSAVDTKMTTQPCIDTVSSLILAHANINVDTVTKQEATKSAQEELWQVDGIRKKEKLVPVGELCYTVTASTTTRPLLGSWATTGTEGELEDWSHRTHQFFTLTFFPAYEHNLMLRKEVQEEHLRQTANPRLALEKVQERARLRQQWEEEEEERRKEDDGERGDEYLNHSSPASSSTSVALKQLTPSGNKKKEKVKH